MPITAEKLPCDTYLVLPEIKQRYEINNGKIKIVPSPTPLQHWISANLFQALDRFRREHSLGVLFYTPLDVIIQKEPLRTR